LVRGDVAALEKILADDLTYVHASGKIDTKPACWRPFVPARFTTFPGRANPCTCAR
jgi:hypothetical protein